MSGMMSGMMLAVPPGVETQDYVHGNTRQDNRMEIDTSMYWRIMHPAGVNEV
jgi:hypothetical protein